MEVSSRRPKPSSHVELTPLWEAVQRYSRLPDHIDPSALFAELTLRLSAPEWEIRQHGLRVLSDLLPVVPNLDSLMIPSVLTQIALNLGHPAPGVRQSSLSVLTSYLRYTSDPEFVLRSVVTIGLDSPTANTSLSSNLITNLPALLDILPHQNVSHQTLVHLVTSISKKLTNISTQRDALDTLIKIRERVGGNRFDHFLESYYPEVKRDLDVLYKVYKISDIRDSGIDLQSIDDRNSISPKMDEDDEDFNDTTNKIVVEQEISFDDGSVTMEETQEEDKKTPRRVTFGGEIVKVRTPDSDVTVENHDSSKVSSSLENVPVEEEEETKEEVEELNNDSTNNTGNIPSFSILPPSASMEVIGDNKRVSGIPLPVAPALHMPHARRSRIPQIKQSQQFRGGLQASQAVSSSSSPGGHEDLWDESLTSSSEGEQQNQEMVKLRGFPEPQLSFLPQDLLNAINNKDDPRTASNGLDSLSQLRLGPREWQGLVVWLASRLSEPRPVRLLPAYLRALGAALPRLSTTTLVSMLEWLVPGVARRLSSVPLSTKLEAVSTLQILMRQAGPARVMSVLSSERCLTARSSKLRENSVLGLLYALMTYPSSEFDTSYLTEKVLSMAPTEPKRRVRQGVLELLSVLAQFVPRSQLVLGPEQLTVSASAGGASAEGVSTGAASAADFSEALSTRLSRRLLPAVSPEGLIVYALHIPPMNGRDVDWVLSGSGSLSSGSGRSRSQLDLHQYTRERFNNWSKDDMMAIGTALPPRNFTYSHNQGEDRFYDQTWASSQPNLSLLPSAYAQSSTRPLYLRYQNGQSDRQRGNVPKQGFPSLSSTTSLSSSTGSLKSQGGGGIAGRSRGSGVADYLSSSSRRSSPLTSSSSRWTSGGTTDSPLPPIDLRASKAKMTELELESAGETPDGQQRSIGDAAGSDRRVGRWSRRHESHISTTRLMTPRLTENNGRERDSGEAKEGTEGGEDTQGSVQEATDGAFKSAGVESAAGSAVQLDGLTGSTPDPAGLPGTTSEPAASSGTGLSRPQSTSSLQLATASPHPQSPLLSSHAGGEEETDEEEAEDGRTEEKTNSGRDGLRRQDKEETEKNLEEVEGGRDGQDHSARTSGSDPGGLGHQDKGEEGRQELEVTSRPLLHSQDITLEDLEETEGGDDRDQNHGDPGTPETKSVGTPSSSEFGGSESSSGTGKGSEQSSSSGHTTLLGGSQGGDDSPEILGRRRTIPRPTKLLRGRSKSVTGGTEDRRPPLFPTSLPPFENPNEAYRKTILQLDNPEWEVVMQGLQGVVRLCRHHSKLLLSPPAAHSLITPLGHSIRNLRSQVSRAACQASKEIFDSIGRFLESEVEELSCALLSRTADTNKFLRGDALSALEAMVDHTNPVRSLPILYNKGAKHGNGLVRTATAHLLLRLSRKLGGERCLSLPREPRDQLILTSARLLSEGSLETRRYAKEIFQQLNQDPRLQAIMSDVVPNNLLRNISKALSKISISNKK